MSVAEYLSRVMQTHVTGIATEHSYRAALEVLFASIEPDVQAVNEPKAVRVGRPDFVFLRNDEITVGHCEAKDVGLSVSPGAMNESNRAQFKRYIKALPNLIYTNCLDFHFYRHGELVREISIADYLMGIEPKPDQFEILANQLKDFAAERLQTITSSRKLAEMMAGKAALIKDVLGNALRQDENLQSELAGQYHAFKDQLIHDLSPGGFADIYAETIAYGMFAARLHDKSLESFSREEALKLLPRSNPFLRNLFSYVAGPTLDARLVRTIDELAEIFQATDLQKLFEGFGKFSRRNDPFIHFYETFLAAYNPNKRKSRGVWYTPEPVVNFIVRAVDDVLKSEFGLADGLADTSKVMVDWETGQNDKKGRALTNKKEMHRVQILDPATGTGTFLAEVIKQIAPKIKDVAPGMWSSYIEMDLIPRIHGFELLMASYAMCHMKLDMMLDELGYVPSGKAPRLGVYLTNSLEEGEAANQTLPFAQWLSNESRLANSIKRDMPIMCVIGNPPYSGESANKGGWIMDLMDAYKKEPGGIEKLKERNPKWINDDYVKFIRLAETMIEKNGGGVLGFITNHGYLDNPTFRGMRWHLLKTFDRIYVLDLHGNAKKKEVAPDGSADNNVFDIMQGVAILIAVKITKTKSKAAPKLAEVFHGDLWGSRKSKYEALWAGGLAKNQWSRLENRAPQFAFVNRDYELEEIYNRGFGVQDLMPVNSVGIVTARDALTIDMDREKLWQRVEDFANEPDTEVLRARYGLGGDVRDWRVQWAKEDVLSHFSRDNLQQIAYRPFDNRWTFYTGTSRGFLCYPRNEVMRHLAGHKNLAIAIPKQTKDGLGGLMISNIAGHKTFSAYDINTIFPLYLYPDTQAEQSDVFAPSERVVNMDPKIRRKIEDGAMGFPSPLVGEGGSARSDETGEGAQSKKGVGADTGENVGKATPTGSVRAAPGQSPTSPQGGGKDTGKPDEVAIFDYIYGVLHCPQYRKTYKEFLKIDFPRIPYPSSPHSFWDISNKGTKLRQLHLMEEQAIGETPYPFEGKGDNLVGKPLFVGADGGETGAVFINKTQSFADVPKTAWEFYIGGYQPAQKWLKDRKGRALSFDDVRHYQRIVKILVKTDAIMKTVKMPPGRAGRNNSNFVF